MHKKTKTILIVGGTSGLGRRLAELYAAEGAQVAIIGRRPYLLEEIRRQTPIQTFALDICAPDSFHRLQKIISDLGGIDILIIAASIVAFNPTLGLDTEQQVIGINVAGFVAAINAGYHHFSQKESGQLVAITSIAAARGNKTAPAYNASKAFQSSYTEGIRLKLLQQNKRIIVTEIIPGYMDTQMGRGDRLFWISDLEKAARQTKTAIDRRKRRAFISKRWRLVYHLYRFLPAFLYTAIINSNIRLRKKT